MATNEDLWVFSEKSELLFELIGGAHHLAEHTGGNVVAVVLGPRLLAEQAIAHGADRSIWMGEQKPGMLVEDVVPTLAQLVEDQMPYGVLIGATTRGRAVTGRLAARVNTAAITDVKAFVFQGDQLQAWHMIFGGGAVRLERSLSTTMLATAGPGVFEALPVDASRKGEISETAFIEPAWRLTLRECTPRGAANVNLPAAKKVICSGRGVAHQEDLAMVEELARVLGGEIACTRPLAEGLGWLPRERYIGISGANVRPDLYLGVGVSGQVQHLVGMADSRMVVAINTDPNAPIFSQTDYGIVNDLYAVVPALIQAIKARKG